MTSILRITQQGVEVRVNRPPPTPAREHVVHDNALPATLSDILVQRFHLTVHIVGEEILRQLHLHRVEMILRIISRDGALPKKEAVPRNPVRTGEHAGKHRRPGWIGIGREHRRGLLDGNALGEHQTAAIGPHTEQIV